MSAPLVRIRPRMAVTAVNPILPQVLAWLAEHDPEHDTYDLWAVAAYWKAHAAAHGNVWEPDHD